MRLPFGFTIVKSADLAELADKAAQSEVAAQISALDPTVKPDVISAPPLDVRTMNALKRLWHDLTHDPYASRGLSFKGCSDEECAAKANPLSAAVYQGIEITPEFVALARTEPWKRA